MPPVSIVYLKGPDVQEPPECVIQGKALFSGAQLSHLQNGVFDERLHSL